MARSDFFEVLPPQCAHTQCHLSFVKRLPGAPGFFPRCKAEGRKYAICIHYEKAGEKAQNEWM